jgi:hypothetical protein
MTPEDAAKILREQSMRLLDYISAFAYAPIDPEQIEDLRKWILVLLELLAESKWMTADIIHDLSKVCEFRMVNIGVSSDLSETKSLKGFVNLDEPPFDPDFFNKLKDFED